jgi:hypothetical protein
MESSIERLLTLSCCLKSVLCYTIVNSMEGRKQEVNVSIVHKVVKTSPVYSSDHYWENIVIWIRHSLQASIASTHRHVQIVVLGSFLHYS